MSNKLKAAPPTDLFDGMIAFFSPLIPPSTRASFCYRQGRVATEEHAAEINVLFGVHGRPDELADRLRALGEDLVDHSWIFESLKQHRKLDFADYSFSRFDEVAQLYRDQPQAATQQALASVIESASEGIRENRDGHVQSEEASYPDPLESIRTPPVTPSLPFSILPTTNSSPESRVSTKQRVVSCSPATSIRQQHCQMPEVTVEEDEQSKAPACSQQIKWAVELEPNPKRIDLKKSGSIVETSKGTDLDEISSISHLAYKEEHGQLSKDVKLEPVEEVSSHALHSPQLSKPSSSTSPSCTNALESVKPFSPSHSLDRSFNPSDFWSNLSTGHSETSDPSAPLELSADDFLATLRPLEDQNQESDYSYLRYGLTLMEHGQNGFVARSKSDEKAAGKQKKKGKTGG